jgi:hypothetical protein
MQNELVSLAAEFQGLKHDFNHFINEHFLPLQSKIFHRLPGYECMEYFRLNSVPGGPTDSEQMGRGHYAIFPPTPPCSPPIYSSSSSHNSIPSLWSIMDSEEDESMRTSKMPLIVTCSHSHQVGNTHKCPPVGPTSPHCCPLLS